MPTNHYASAFVTSFSLLSVFIHQTWRGSMHSEQRSTLCAAQGATDNHTGLLNARHSHRLCSGTDKWPLANRPHPKTATFLRQCSTPGATPFAISADPLCLLIPDPPQLQRDERHVSTAAPQRSSQTIALCLHTCIRLQSSHQRRRQGCFHTIWRVTAGQQHWIAKFGVQQLAVGTARQTDAPGSVATAAQSCRAGSLQTRLAQHRHGLHESPRRAADDGPGVQPEVHQQAAEQGVKEGGKGREGSAASQRWASTGLQQTSDLHAR